MLWLLTPFSVENVVGTRNQLLHGYCPVRYGTIVLTLSMIVTFAGVTALVRDYMPAANGVLGHAMLFLGLFGPSVWDSRSVDDWTTFFRNCCTGSVILLAGMSLCYMFKGTRLARRAIAPILAVSCLCIGVTVAGLGVRWHAGYSRFYDEHLRTAAVSFLDRADPLGIQVTVCVTDRAYPFGGSARRRTVAELPFIESAEQAWQELQHLAPKFIVVARRPASIHQLRVASILLQISLREGNALTKVFEDDRYTVFAASW
jgi:hypothetical protein